MKILKGFYKKGSEGYVELVEFNNHYYVRWEIANEANKYNYAFWTYPTLEEAEEKYKELEKTEMDWK